MPHCLPALVLGAGQGLPAASFLPFLGRKPSQWWAPGWSLSRGGGLSHHAAPQSDSVPMSPPVPGEPGPQKEVDKWGGILGWPESFRPLWLDACCPLLLSCLPWPALGMPHRWRRPQEPLHGARPRCLCRSGGGTGWAVRTLAASLACVPRARRGDFWAPDTPGVRRLDPERQWGPFFARAGESPSGGAQPRPWGTPMPAS